MKPFQYRRKIAAQVQKLGETSETVVTARAISILAASAWQRFTKRELKLVLRYLTECGPRRGCAPLTAVLAHCDLTATGAVEGFAWFATRDEEVRRDTIRAIEKRLAVKTRGAS